MPAFNIDLKDDKLTGYRRFTLIVIITLSLLFIYLVTVAGSSVSWFGIYLSLGLMVLLLVFQLFDKKDRRGDFYAGYFIALMMGWSNLRLYWLAVATLLLLLLYSFATRKKNVVFNEDGVSYPSFPRKKIQWQELNNVLIKDGLLTLDYKNNKLIQQPVDENKSSINEKEFNEFCSQQLRLKAKS